MKKTFIIFFVIICALFSSCKLDNFAPIESLHPPLSLSLTSTNNIIYISFWSLNSENSFSGYNIYIGTNESQVSNMQTPISNYSTGNLPFYNPGASQQATLQNAAISNDNSGLPLAARLWYIGITAYDLPNNANSVMSDIASITLIP